MCSLLIRNIRQLIQVRDSAPKMLKGADMAQLPLIDNAWLRIRNGIIDSYGTMESCPEKAGEIIDAAGGSVFPTWCDSHTHLVFAGSREGEFVDKIKGRSYEEIAASGGGILNSAKLLQQTSEAELVIEAQKRIDEIVSYGTGAVEIKSGYGFLNGPAHHRMGMINDHAHEIISSSMGIANWGLGIGDGDGW